MTQKGVSLQTHIEVTRHYATKYSMASKKLKGQLLDTVRRITGWNWDHPEALYPYAVYFSGRFVKIPGISGWLKGQVSARKATPAP